MGNLYSSFYGKTDKQPNQLMKRLPYVLYKEVYSQHKDINSLLMKTIVNCFSDILTYVIKIGVMMDMIKTYSYGVLYYSKSLSSITINTISSMINEFHEKLPTHLHCLICDSFQCIDDTFCFTSISIETETLIEHSYGLFVCYDCFNKATIDSLHKDNVILCFKYVLTIKKRYPTKK